MNVHIQTVKGVFDGRFLVTVVYVVGLLAKSEFCQPTRA